MLASGVRCAFHRLLVEVKNITDANATVRGAFTRLLDLIRNFIVFEDDGEKVTKLRESAQAQIRVLVPRILRK
jgi:type I site-specific restriction-modification system R (restriction) subunit